MGASSVAGTVDDCVERGSLTVYASPPFVHDDTVTTGVFWWLHGAPSPQFGWFSTDFDAATGQQLERPSGVIAGRRGNGSLTVAPYVATFNGIPFGPYGPMAYASFGLVDGPRRTITIASTTTGSIHAGGCGEVTCTPLWTADAGSSITGAPAVSNGTLSVGTADGRLLAYR